MKKAPTGPDQLARLSAPVGIRTPNLLIRSQMLYPLSYGRPFISELGQSNGLPVKGEPWASTGWLGPTAVLVARMGARQ